MGQLRCTRWNFPLLQKRRETETSFKLGNSSSNYSKKKSYFLMQISTVSYKKNKFILTSSCDHPITLASFNLVFSEFCAPSMHLHQTPNVEKFTTSSSYAFDHLIATWTCELQYASVVTSIHLATWYLTKNSLLFCLLACSWFSSLETFKHSLL